MSYQPIEDYGIIGNMRTVALVGMNGSIDWLCFPNFDSPSVFARILDDKKGGHFSISPVRTDRLTLKRFYWPDTNVLVSRFLAPEGVAEIIDFMPVSSSVVPFEEHPIIRFVRVARGEMSLRLECKPAFDYARKEHSIEVHAGGAHFHSDGLSLGFLSLTDAGDKAGEA